jgi:membrane-associated phospholipid phosphatase
VDPSSTFPPAAWAAAGLLAACAARPLHPWIRAALSPALAHHVRAQLPAVAAAQRAARSLERAAPPLGRALAAAVALSAATVTVEFYIAALPLLVWAGGPLALAGLKLVGLLATSGYAAYALKDLLASPRPGEAAARVLAAAAAAAAKRTGAKALAAAASRADAALTPSGRRSTRLAARHAEMQQRDEEEAEAAGGDAAAPPSVLAAARALRVRDHGKDVEDGAPSSHVSLSLPMTLHALALLWPLLAAASPAAAAAAAASPPAPPPLGAVLSALAWVALVGWGRLYLGVHAPLDLFAGAALGHLSLVAWRGPVEDAWLRWAMTTTTAATAAAPSTSTAVPVAAAAVALLAMRMHPVPTRPTDCFNYSTAFVGAGLGATLGAWAFAPQLLRAFAGGGAAAAAAATPTDPPLLVLLVACYALKACVGLAAVLGTRAAVKAALLAALPPLLDLAPWPLRALWQPPPADATALSPSAGARGQRRRRKEQLSSSSLPPRRPDNGVPYDVDAAARLASYTAAVFVVVAHAALWPSSDVVAAAAWAAAAAAAAAL